MSLPGCCCVKWLPECQHPATTALSQPANRIEPAAIEPATAEPTTIELQPAPIQPAPFQPTTFQPGPAFGRAERILCL